MIMLPTVYKLCVPLKETSHSVVLSADVVTDLECMPALCKGAEL